MLQLSFIFPNSVAHLLMQEQSTSTLVAAGSSKRKLLDNSKAL